MNQPTNQQPASPADTSEDEPVIEQAPHWPWWLKVGVAIALATVWLVMFAKPALGNGR